MQDKRFNKKSQRDMRFLKELLPGIDISLVGVIPSINNEAIAHPKYELDCGNSTCMKLPLPVHRAFSLDRSPEITNTLKAWYKQHKDCAVRTAHA